MRAALKNTYRIIPVYTGDVSGTCSALYEFGGMTVIHDPSGCNSTYNTHDETRWYDRESLIYISGLNEVDAITGNDEKFINDIILAADTMKPKFIAMTNSPLPYLNGTDFKGIAKLLERRLNIPCFYVKSNGSHDYSCGAGDALLELAKKLKKTVQNKKDEKKDAVKINILGLTPLDFDAPGVVEDMLKKFDDFEIISTWAMGCDLDSIKRATLADVNVVVSVTGIKLAKWMYEEYGIPYVYGSPVGDFAKELIADIKNAAETGQVKNYKDFKGDNDESSLKTDITEMKHTGEKIYLIGEPVTMWSLKNHLKLHFGTDATVINPLETDFDFADKKTLGEEDLENILKDADVVAGDPFYRYITPANAKFIPMSHQAFSGRCFNRERVNLFGEDVYKIEIRG